MKMYDWGIFWEDGNKAGIPVPFGPEHPEDNLIGSLSDPWVNKISEYLPNFVETVEELPFALIIVNPPREATEEEVEFWTDKGFEDKE